MLCLLGAILTSASISVLMRLTEKKVKSSLAMFAGNYAVCVLLSGLYMGNVSFMAEKAGLSCLLGTVSGVLFLAAFLLLKKSITANGVMLSSMFMKLGVLVPTLSAILFFHEQMRPMVAAGFAVALVAILLLNGETGERTGERSLGLLLTLLLVGGMADTMSNVQEELGNARCKDIFLLTTFLSALLCTAVLLFIRERKTASMTDALMGAVIGIPNYFSTRLLLLALNTMPAVVAYPVYSTAVPLVVSGCGILLFHEHLTKKKALAFLAMLAALLLLNLG